MLPLFAYICFYYRKGKRVKDFLLFVVVSFLSCASTVLIIFPKQIVQEFFEKGSQVFGQYDIVYFFPITIGKTFVNAISVPLLIIYAVSGAYLIWKRKFSIMLISLIIILPYCLFYAGLSGAPERYFLCTLPFILLPMCAACDRLLSKEIRMRSKGDFRGKKKRLDSAGEFGSRRILTYVVLAVVIAIIPWFGKRYDGHLGKLMRHSRQDHLKIASEKVGRSVGKNLVLVVADEPMIHYYNRRNPPRTAYVYEKKNPYEITVAQDKLEEAIERIQAGEPVYMTTYALNVLEDTNLKLHYTTVWEYGNYALYKITEMYVE